MRVRKTTDLAKGNGGIGRLVLRVGNLENPPGGVRKDFRSIAFATATDGDQASPSVSDEAGAGATSLECKQLCSHVKRKGDGRSRCLPKPT